MQCPENCAICDGPSCLVCHVNYHQVLLQYEGDGEPRFGCGAEVGRIPYCMELRDGECVTCSYGYTPHLGKCAMKCGDNLIQACEVCYNDKCQECHANYQPAADGLSCVLHDNVIDHCVYAENGRCQQCQFRYSLFENECIKFQCGIDECISCTQKGICLRCGSGKEVYYQRCENSNACGIPHCMECVQEPSLRCLRCMNNATPNQDNHYQCLPTCGDVFIARCTSCKNSVCEACEDGFLPAENHLSCLPVSESCHIPGCLACESPSTCAECVLDAGLSLTNDKTKCIYSGTACLCAPSSAKDCIPDCLFCSSGTACLVCRDGYLSSKGQCVRECPDNEKPALRYLFFDNFGLVKRAICTRCQGGSSESEIDACRVCNYNGVGCAVCKDGYHGWNCTPKEYYIMVNQIIFGFFVAASALFFVLFLRQNRLSRNAKPVSVD